MKDVFGREASIKRLRECIDATRAAVDMGSERCAAVLPFLQAELAGVLQLPDDDNFLKARAELIARLNYPEFFNKNWGVADNDG